ncbi:MAG: peptidase S9, partial [Bacteroidetes bacterium]
MLFCGLLFWFGSGLWAQDTAPDRWTPEDIIHTETFRNAQFSPDKKMVVWTKRRGVKKSDKFVSDLWLTRLDIEKDGQFKTIRLTQSDESDYSPFFSKDGETIYFLSSREKGKKLWALSIYGGEPAEVSEFKNGISSPKWLNDSTLLYTSNDGKTWYEQDLKEKKDNTVVVEDEDHWTIRKLYAFDVKSKKSRRITNNAFPVSDYSVSKDGRFVVFSTTQSLHYPSDAQPKPKIYLQNIETGETVEILAGIHAAGNFEFTADHTGF